MKKPDENNSADNIARETMTGDLRDCLLDFLKHDKNPLPWNLQTEQSQYDAIEKCTKAAKHAVERAVKIIAADGRQTIVTTVEKVTIKDGIKVELTLSKSDPQRHVLVDSQGATVLLVVANNAAYEGEKKPANPEPNQRELLEDDKDAA